MINITTNLCKRLDAKELLTNAPVYTSCVSDGASGGLSLVFKSFATKKTAGSTKNGRDSLPKNLGVNKLGGERVIPGNIIIRQRGTRFHPGNYVGIGKGHTLYALKEGTLVRSIEPSAILFSSLQDLHHCRSRFAPRKF